MLKTDRKVSSPFHSFLMPSSPKIGILKAILFKRRKHYVPGDVMPTIALTARNVNCAICSFFACRLYHWETGKYMIFCVSEKGKGTLVVFRGMLSDMFN